MYLVEILGDRYLWVDSLCIVQDDFTFKEREIDNMASIYANADITIVAGQGTDADSGLRGLRHCGTPQSRNLTQDIIQLRAFDILRRKPDLSGRSPWAGRAWNLQEFMLSRRVITFDEETVRWECDLNRWHEDRTVCHRVRETEVSRGIRAILKRPLPDIHQFLVILQSYRRKELTYPNDSLNSFTGILRALENIFTGGFVGGLPVMRLDLTLLWQPARYNPIPFKRIISEPYLYSLPSWSWAGWDGLLNISMIKGECIDTAYRMEVIDHEWPSIIEILPLVRWLIREHPTSSPTSLSDSWYGFRRKLESELPKTWSKHKSHRVQKGSNSVWPLQYYYTHRSCSVTKCTYPIPYYDRRKSPKSPSRTLLSYRTKRGWLLMGEIFEWSQSIVLRMTNGT
ncbi:hypothetical protein OCU04_003525 [Sclerotinia nivalis]|uniref:Heterokaryon incompatibility domain-containing protein n=1 Tax=Sclerotinia nivalis TaxID=352851 RepID=A0A9X0AT19_9HELO|nr:hypothetical protein OCU04_003525 [Sclerotinia nivalis]